MLRLLLICPLFATIVCFECTELVHGSGGNGYFGDPEDCAKMIRCSNGKITHRFVCSEGKVFNDITKSCDDPKYVNCHKQSSTTTDTASTSPSPITDDDEPRYEAPIAAKLQSVSNPFLKSLGTSSVKTQETTITTNSTRAESVTTESPVTQQSLRKNLLFLNESYVEYEETRKPIVLNQSYVIYDERLVLPFNESFVIYEEEGDEENKEEVTPVLTTTTTENPTELLTTESIELTTVLPVIPTTIDSIILPVLESIIQNESLTETTELTTEFTTTISTTQVTTESSVVCAIDESDAGLRMVSSNYWTNETSKLTDFYKIVCYFTNWSRHRTQSAKFIPNNVNPFLCTHIIYAFAILDNQTLTMKSSDECTDIDNRFYEQITALKDKNPKLKVMIALGGWVDSEGDKYSRLVSSQTNRLNFIENAVNFIERHNFDGLDLDWEYPRCWQSDCSAGPLTDKINFGIFLRELRLAFNKRPKQLLLSAAVGAAKYIVDNSYEINSLMINLDFLNIMTYDFYTTGSSVAAHHSPLYSHPNARDLDHSVLNANFSINYWIRKGVPSHKIVFGIPFYGRTFKLLDSQINDFGSAVNGTGDRGFYTKENGFLAYYEICANILQNGWAKRTDTYARKGRPLITGPYAYDGYQWVGYDDRDHIIQKTDFIKDNNLGGAMVWALDLDDFNGICCKTKSPLLKTINQQLREYSFDLKFFCP